MMRVKYFAKFILGPIGLVVLSILYGSWALAQEPQEPLTLEESVKIAVERSLTIHSAVEGVVGSEYKHKETITNFLPSWTGQYTMGRYNAPALVGPIPIVLPVTLPGLSAFTSRDVYGLSTSVNQPVFTGGLNLANYRSAKLGVDLSKTNVETARLDLTLQVRVGYFTILRAEKYLDVAEQQVKQFEAQLEVTKAFFDAEKVSMNDVLQAQVSLADARQSMAKTANDVVTAKASLNTLLRREVTTPFEVVDILAYKAFPLSYEQSLEETLRLRPEIKRPRSISIRRKRMSRLPEAGSSQRSVLWETITGLLTFGRCEETSNSTCGPSRLQPRLRCGIGETLHSKWERAR